MKIIKRHRLASVSPWVLAAACGLLTLIIAVFAVNNYQRDKALMTDILLEKGATIIRFVASSSRSSIIGGLGAGKSLESMWPENVQLILEHASGHPGVAFLALVDDQGMIVANAAPEDRNHLVSAQTRSFISALEDDSMGARTFNFHIANDKKPTVFQIAAILPPIGKGFIQQLEARHRTQMQGMGGSMMSASRLQDVFTKSWKKELEKLNKRRFVILVELDMAQFNQRLQRQKLEIIILSIIL